MSTQRETDETNGEADSALSGGYDPEAVEPKWRDHWVDDETYRFGDGDVDPDTAYTIDTPPPTVSGSLHMGHLYGHTLQDFAGCTTATRCSRSATTTTGSPPSC